MTPQDEYKNRHKQSNLCQSCPDRAAPDRTYCPTHLEALRLHAKRKRDEKRERENRQPFERKQKRQPVDLKAARKRAAKAYRLRHKQQSKCLDCSKPTIPHRARCAEHLTYHRVRSEVARIMQRRKEKRLRYQLRVSRWPRYTGSVPFNLFPDDVESSQSFSPSPKRKRHFR